ncbi:hypothetical protein BDZ89DRAFT_1071860 [Hymenopellis radicata]|nr:hypothetical protein BDZ89DRAFT_1071860 [Hymenopellis radicata]
MHGAEHGLVVSDLLCRTTHRFQTGQWVSKDWQDLQDVNIISSIAPRDTFGLTVSVLIVYSSEAMDKSMRMITTYVEVACARRAPYP